MINRLGDLRNKEVINVQDGTRMGYVGDIALDTERAQMTHLVICGKPRFFGLLGKASDVVIPWEQVQTIGAETILVHYTPPVSQTPRDNWIKRAFREK